MNVRFPLSKITIVTIITIIIIIIIQTQSERPTLWCWTLTTPATGSSALARRSTSSSQRQVWFSSSRDWLKPFQGHRRSCSMLQRAVEEDEAVSAPHHHHHNHQHHHHHHHHHYHHHHHHSPSSSSKLPRSPASWQSCLTPKSLTAAMTLTQSNRWTMMTMIVMMLVMIMALIFGNAIDNGFNL